MSSATKTLELLDYFSTLRPEIGLSQLCRLAGWDKATTYRRLQALEETGFVEQNQLTKHYRLGPSLLRLAQMRESTVPRKASIEAPLQALADATGETTHVSLLSGTSLHKLQACESPSHSTRVIIDIQQFPLHATASGLCALAFGPKELLPVAAASLTSYTSNTLISVECLKSKINDVRATGFSRAEGSFEIEVCSIATPLFDQSSLFAGAVSVASVATRFTPELEQLIKRQLIIVSRQITHSWGGTVPAPLEQIWSTSFPHSQSTETTL